MPFKSQRKSLKRRHNLRAVNRVYLRFPVTPGFSNPGTPRFLQWSPPAMPANRSELRKKPRRQFHYHARILIQGDKPFACAISDISETGARIQLEDERELPDRFILLLTPNGDARRHCRMVWRHGLFVGVEFPNVQV
jgi:PilZ domain